MQMRLHHKKAGFASNATRAALFALLCSLLSAHPAEAENNFPGQRPVSSTANSDFAIADFDGDRKPDLATVEIQKVGSSREMRYSIRFKLASGNGQVFGVTAPAGGLQLVALDVNGDNALDVLVSSVWQHKQVAVFLNDGHGNFAPADPSSFPGAEEESEARWNSGYTQLFDSAVLLRSQNSAGSTEEEIRFDGPRRQVGVKGKAVSPNFSHLLLFSLLGRAPPQSILQP